MKSSRQFKKFYRYGRFISPIKIVSFEKGSKQMARFANQKRNATKIVETVFWNSLVQYLRSILKQMIQSTYLLCFSYCDSFFSGFAICIVRLLLGRLPITSDVPNELSPAEFSTFDNEQSLTFERFQSQMFMISITLIDFFWKCFIQRSFIPYSIILWKYFFGLRSMKKWMVNKFLLNYG